jgi:hypothetical protein
MFNYTQANHVKFGYDGKLYNDRESNSSVLWCGFGRCVRTPHAFREELAKTAVDVFSSTNEKIYVLMSGGMDSELVLRSFMMSNLQVSAISVEFSDLENRHDIAWAKEFCKTNQIEHTIVPLNLKKEWKNIVRDYGISTSCTSPQFSTLMWLIERVPGFPVLGSGDSAIKRVENTNRFYFHEYENYLCLYKFMMKKNIHGVPAFLQYSPELMYSFFTHPTLLEYINGKARREKILSIKKYKAKIYSQSFPDLIERLPCNGYEYLSDLDLQHRAFLEAHFPGAGQRISFEYQNFVGSLMAEGIESRQGLINEY